MSNDTPATAPEASVKELSDKLAALEKAVGIKTKPQIADTGPTLAECNARYREVEAELSAERKSAAEIAKRAIDAALKPTFKQKGALAKGVKPLSPVVLPPKAEDKKA